MCRKKKIHFGRYRKENEHWFGKVIIEIVQIFIFNWSTSRSLNAITTWVKLYLQNEQKKSDYKPETDDFDTVASPVNFDYL